MSSGRHLFYAANTFNVATNFLSGNDYPLEEKDSSRSAWRIGWLTIVWLVRVTHFSTVTLGSLYFANLTREEAFNKSGALGVVYLELMIPLIHLNFRRRDLKKLVGRYSRLLVDSDEMREKIRETVGPCNRGLKIYTLTCLPVVVAWSAAPILTVFQNDRFTYANFTAPAYLPGEPFGVKTFLAGVALQVFGATLVNLAKMSTDIYICYLITLLTSQFRYVRVRIRKALSVENRDETELRLAFRECLTHHSAVIKTSQMLAEILAFYIGSTYITCILKFCFLAFGIFTFENANIEKATYLVYTFACVIQTFLICSCIQELIDESTSVTRDAFHENWYERSITVKKMFFTMEMTNQMECRLSAYRVIVLVVPTLSVILSKSYSVCLLLLKVN